MLAGTEINGAVLFGGVGYGGESGAFVGAVAKRLGFALAAGTPVVGLASFNGDGDG
jgi:hypothetical protein